MPEAPDGKESGIFSRLGAGAAGGALAGLLLAFFEGTFLRATVGAFWADFAFLLRSLVLYVPLGSAAGALAGLTCRLPAFRFRSLRALPPFALSLGLIFGAGLIFEILVYLTDLHTFRGPGGRWSSAAWGIFSAGVLLAGFLGWLSVKVVRYARAGGLRRRRLYVGGLGIVLLAGFFAAGRWAESRTAPFPAGASRPANVILVVIDSLRADHLSAYGHALPTSPFLDRLAREGVLFRDCLAASTWTLPTHASLFTGLYPSSHGSYSLFSEFNTSLPSLPRILSARGYRTASFHDNPLVGGRFGLSGGFQTALGVDNEHKVSLAIDRVWNRLRGRRSSTSTILQTAERWITREGKETNRPFFVFLNVLDVHTPYRPRQPFLDEFLKSLPGEKVDRDLIRACTSDAINDRRTAERLFPRLNEADWRVLSRYYDANIRAVDEDFGRFFEKLRSRGSLDNTLVIVTSDHGELLGEVGGGGHSQAGLRPEVLRVPLVFWFPQRLPAEDVSRTVSQVDIFPTVLRLAGLAPDIPRGIQGTDLFSPSPGRGILAESWDETIGAFDRAWIVGDYKLDVKASGRNAVFDRKTDPGETRNLAAENSDLLNSLLKGLNDQLGRMPKARTEIDPRKRKELERRLRSLGYL